MILFLIRLFRRKTPDFRKLVPSKPLVAVTLKEGGTWYEFPLRDHEDTPEIEAAWRSGCRVHSMLFEDGSVWDAINGWRQRRTSSCWIVRITGKHEWWYATAGFVA